MSWHVIPDDDWMRHEPSEDCVCGPVFKVEDGVDLLVHQTLDDRETAACPTCGFGLDDAVPAVGTSATGWPVPCPDPFHSATTEGTSE